MKFIVRREYNCYDDKPPCEDATREQYIRIDERTSDAPEKIPSSRGKSAWWYETGQNHRVENGHIKRDFTEFAWFVDILTLDDLFRFAHKYSPLGLQFESWDNPAIPQLEIPDSDTE